MQNFDPDFERCFNYFLIIDQVRANDRIVWPSSFDGNWRTSERIILSSRHNFFKGGEKRQKRRKDGRKMATIKYPDDRPKKNSRRAKSERQKWNISRPFDNLFRAFVYNITKRCRSRKRMNARRRKVTREWIAYTFPSCSSRNARRLIGRSNERVNAGIKSSVAHPSAFHKDSFTIVD